VDPNVQALAAWLAAEGTGLTIRSRRAGWELATDPEIAEAVRQCRGMRKRRLLTDYARETLFILMRRGPSTKAEIQEIRRIDDVGPVLRTLRREGLVVKAGRRTTPGRPTIYRATPEATKRFPDLERMAQELLGQLASTPERGEGGDNERTEWPDRPEEAGPEDGKCRP